MFHFSRRSDGYLLKQGDLNKAVTRDPEHWPRNAFVAAFADAIGVDESDAGTLAQQVACFGNVDWPTIYFATEMFFHGTPVNEIRSALKEKNAAAAMKKLFDREF